MIPQEASFTAGRVAPGCSTRKFGRPETDARMPRGQTAHRVAQAGRSGHFRVFRQIGPPRDTGRYHPSKCDRRSFGRPGQREPPAVLPQEPVERRAEPARVPVGQVVRPVEQAFPPRLGLEGRAAEPGLVRQVEVEPPQELALPAGLRAERALPRGQAPAEREQVAEPVLAAQASPQPVPQEPVVLPGRAAGLVSPPVWLPRRVRGLPREPRA